MSEEVDPSRVLLRRCPGCGDGMQGESFERKNGGHVDLDLCFACHGIWFDPFESTALTPGAVLKLFQEIHEKRDMAPRPLGGVLRCPRCRSPLTLTYDMQRSNRITYYRCMADHGRFTTFVQFLREKNFIRSLTVGEIERLKSMVKQVRCASCGAPIDLERDAACSYCHAPIAILDAEAVQRTVAELGSEERARRDVRPAAAVDAILAGQRSARAVGAWDFTPASPHANVVDLVGEALDFLMQR